MAQNRSLKAINRTLQDMRNCKAAMVGVTTVLSGDFPQTLPVIPKVTKADEIKTCLKFSPLWKHVKTMELSTNMRTHLYGDRLSGHFAENLLLLGDGKMPVDSKGMLNPNGIGTTTNSIDDLIARVFPNISLNYQNHSWICERAILAPKNVAVKDINIRHLSSVPGQTSTYKSIDTVTKESEAVHYPIEFFNSSEPHGLPSYELHLKIGVPIMLLRNLDHLRLCNGTPLIVKKLLPHVIEATILTGCAKGDDVFIPRIPLQPSDFPFKFRRVQFPIRVSFAMSINKSQGQTLSMVGLQLQEHCFSHVQLYVGCSRVGSATNLIIHSPTGKKRNIVYNAVLQ